MMTSAITTSVYDRLHELGIALPAPTAPAAAFLPCTRSGNLVFVSGHIARANARPWTGKLGHELTTEQGKEAARAAAVDLLATLHQALGDLNKVRRILKVGVLVDTAPQFAEQHLVANGASELFVEVFGDAGKHARTAFGVSGLPLGSCVEVELIAEVQ